MSTYHNFNYYDLNLILYYSISLGAGIVVESLSVPKLYSRLLFNPLCTLLLGDSTSPPSEGSVRDVRKR